MKKLIKQVLGSLAGVALLSSCSFANNGYGQTPNYGSSQYYGAYNSGQGYSGNSYQTSYYSQGYNSYNQGYQGQYQTQNTGMGNNFSYVDNNWIEDQLRFAVTDVNQNRPYQAMQKLYSLSSYVRKFGDSELYRRVQLTIQLGYKSSLKTEINSIYGSFKSGGMRLGWESGANQSYQGQDDLSKKYITDQFRLVMADLNSGQQNRARQRLRALQGAIPPQGNERLVRRVYYAASVNRPSQMKTEVQSIISEINAGTLLLNDTENNAANFYGTGTNPYSQPDYSGVGGGSYTQGGGSYNQNPGGFQGDGRYGTPGQYQPQPQPVQTGLPPFGNNTAQNPGYDTVNYNEQNNGNPSNNGQGSSGIDFNQNNPYQPSTNNGTSAPTTQAPQAPTVDLAQLKSNVNEAYSKLKTALASGDGDKIMTARDEYAKVQAAYEAGKNQ
ncbi:MAG: hypothetical protein COB02_09935 [Candidatus Cloacimonadota bacterium]|nr:MAG: hypothetical protein COB02_09935 [Candidatus Cloacimonadota bacterium]